MATTTSTEYELHGSMTYWIMRLAAVMKDSFNDALADQDVSWPQWMVLSVLNDEGQTTPARIAEAAGLDRSGVTRLLDRLADKGFLERQHDDGDRRSVKVALTRSGRQRMGRINRQAQEHQSFYLSHLPATEVRVFKSHLQKLLRAGGVETRHLWRGI